MNLVFKHNKNIRMKKRNTLLSILILLVLFTGFGYEPQNDFEYFYELYKKKDYFRLKTLVNQEKESLEHWQSYVITCFVATAFGKYEISNNLIRELKGQSVIVPDSIMARVYITKSNNDIKLGNYKDAFESSKIVLDKYSAGLDEKTLEDVKNSMIIWEAISNVPKMNLLNRKNTKIQMKLDLAGLYNVPVRVNSSVFEFVFDTGANISTITQSNADKSGVEILGNEFDVGTSTGDKVKAKIGIAKKFQLGELIFENVVFIVIPDAALEFGGGVYKISGIVGFPVMQEMKEIRINKMYELIIPEEKITISNPNLFFDEFTPVVQGFIDNDTLNLLFDSGARNSSLYEPYYQMHKKEIEDNYEFKIIKIQGAGTEKELKAYIIGEKEIRIYNKSGVLKNLDVYTEPLKENDNNYAGKIGRDYMGEFDEVIINFEHPALILR